jgi:outer membrane immunogenic protein
MKLSAIGAVAFLAAGFATTVAAQDWTGPYAGMSLSSVEYGYDFPGLPFTYSSEDGAALGIFAGYNYAVSDQVIVGGEVSWTSFNTEGNPAVPYFGEDMLQVRGRLGYAMDTVMPYVAVGYAQSTTGIFATPLTQDMSGYSFGLGVEFMVGGNMSIRMEYGQAVLDGETSAGFPPNPEATVETLNLGAAFHF